MASGPDVCPTTRHSHVSCQEYNRRQEDARARQDRAASHLVPRRWDYLPSHTWVIGDKNGMKKGELAHCAIKKDLTRYETGAPASGQSRAAAPWRAGQGADAVVLYKPQKSTEKWFDWQWEDKGASR